MTIELKVPTVGESITEVQIGEWLKAEGDRAEKDEIVAMIETDKVTVELPAPVSGVISKILVKQGEAASVGDVIAHMEEGESARTKPKAKADDDAKTDEDEPKQKADSAASKAGKKEAASKQSPKSSEAGSEAAPGDEGAAAPPGQEDAKPDEPETEGPRSVRDSLPPQAFARVMPSARRVLKEKGLRAEDVEASGPGGRLLKEDVVRHEQPRKSDAPSSTERPASGREEDVVAMSPLRRRVAERLVESQQTAALLTTFNEIDMTGAMALRREQQEAFTQKYGIKLGFMSFFVKAAIEALKLVPAVNAEIRGTDIVYKNYFDIGVAVGGGKGLVVPVIRNAERLSFAEVEQKIADYAKRASANKLKLQEIEGGTFTISNGGIYGSLLSTPIINPPQSGILGMHAIQERAVVRDGQIVVRPMMYVALTYDHRLVDGREAVTFLKRIKECVENPARILLEV